MRPKRRRAGDSSQAQEASGSGAGAASASGAVPEETGPTFDRAVFLDREAYDIYLAIRSRPVLRERTIPCAAGDQMRVLGWGPFMDSICSASLSLSREFHAHLRMRGGQERPLVRTTEEVWCRGHRLPLSQRVLNALYSLPDTGFDFFAWAADIDLEEVTDRLCPAGVIWAPSAQGGVKWFDKTRLAVRYRAVFMFLIASLWPTSHEPHVTPIQAKLIYAIDTEQRVDLGQILLDSFYHAAEENTGLGFSHSSVIQRLWEIHGPPGEFSYEDGVPPQSPLDRTLMRRFREPAPLPPAQTATPPTEVESATLGSILSAIQGLRADVARHDRHADYRSRRFEYFYTHQGSLDGFPEYQSPVREDPPSYAGDGGYGAGTSQGDGGDGGERPAFDDADFDPSLP